MRLAAVLLVTLLACDATFRFDEQSIDGGARCHDSAACHGLRCDRESGFCVECTDDDDCKRTRPRCETGAHVCVECLEQRDCGGDRACEPTTHRCIEACTGSDPSCAECAEDANCTSAAGGRFCDRAIGRCVECTTNAQCANGTAVCDRRTGRCAECVSSTACGLGRLCDPESLSCRAP
jgi:Cys-rich repeat protein